jgi:hypothetical protein
MSRFPVAFRLHGVRFLVIPSPLGNWASLTVGLPAPATRSGTSTGLSRFARMRHGRRGRPLNPGDGGARTTGAWYPVVACRFPTAQSLRPRPCSHHPGLNVTRHHQGFTVIRPPGLPLACDPRIGQGPLGFSPELHTPPSPATHVEVGTGIGHLPELRHHHQAALQST